MIPEDPNDPLLQTKQCQNCGAPLWVGDLYCPECGQKQFEGPPSLWSLFRDFFDTVFNLDNRLFRTLGGLAVPGHLTLAYFAGKRKPYFNPLRTFFVCVLGMMAISSFVLVRFYGDYLDEERRSDLSRGYQQAFDERVIATVDEARQRYPADSVLLSSLEDSLRYDSEGEFQVKLFYGGQRLGGDNNIVRLTLRELAEKGPEQLAEDHEVTHPLDRYLFVQQVKINQSGARGVMNLFGQLIWGFVFLIPACALFLKLLYIRRGRYYVEHFVFTLYQHARLTIFVAVAVLVLWFTDQFLILPLIIIPSTIYLIGSLRAVYQQSWIKTTLKSFIFMLGYVILLTVSLLFSLFVSIGLY